MEVGLLGPLLVLGDDGDPMEVAGARQRTLLVLLALRPGVAVTADRLIEELWPGEAPKRPDNALQVAISKLRRTIGDRAILTRPNGYQLAVDRAQVDGFRLEALAQAGREADRAGRPDEALAAFEEALGLWRDTPLAEFADVVTAQGAAREWIELRSGMQEDRYAVLLRQGRAAELIAELERAVAAEPYRERLAGQLMVALYRSGRQADALRAFEQARQRLAEDLGLTPGPELRAIEAAILAQDPDLDEPRHRPRTTRVGGSAPSAPIRARTNVGRARTSLVGRDGDVAAVLDQLATARLVSLVGPGGAGKTRLATAVAAELVDTSPGGVWFASLEAATDASSTLTAVASAIGLTPADGLGQPGPTVTPLQERIVDVLALDPAVLVIDNCEQVVDAVAGFVDDLLDAVPHLRVLATSRETLRVPGEVLYPVASLALDDAVELFVERARAVDPGFATAPTDPDLHSLCARLDRLPLAIELAAARMNAFTVEQVADSLPGPEVLSSGAPRIAVPRQQSLRAITAWSYDLLSDQERQVFERLAVFAGPCPLTAAAAVCADDASAPGVVAATLGRLVDKSLVVADPDGRFRLLFTLADFARERLVERGVLDALRVRHADHFRRLAEVSFTDWRSPGGRSQAWWLDELAGVQDDLLAALAWSLERDDAETAQGLAGGLAWYWWHSGQAAAGRDRLTQALACGGEASDRVRAAALAWLVWLSFETGDSATAAAHTAEAIDLARQVDATALLGMLHVVSAQVAWTGGDVGRAIEQYETSARISTAAGDAWSLGVGGTVQAMALALRGDVAGAEHSVLDAANQLRSVGDIGTLVIALGLLAALRERREDLDGARTTLEDARAISEGHGLRASQATMSIRLGAVAARQGRLDEAEKHYGSAYDLGRATAVPRLTAIALDGLVQVHRAAGEADAARQDEEELARLARRHGPSVTRPLAPFAPR